MKAVTFSACTLALALVIAAPLHGSAQTTSTTSKSEGKTSAAGSGKLASADSKFITEAAEGGLAEVEMGRLASERGSSDAVKQFGQRMVTDHGKANDELKQLAQEKGVTVPTELNSKDKKQLDRLSKLSGADFDKAYARDMVRDHNKDVKEFQKQAQKGRDADLKSWAGKTLPVLQEHEQQAKQMSASVGAAGGRRTGAKSGSSGSMSGSSTTSGSTSGAASPSTAPSSGSR
jgi:putative membrane protein